MTREELVKIARECVGGVHRPEDECSFVSETGAEHECPHGVGNPATYDVPEWVLEAMRRAYERGHEDGWKAESERPF